MQTREIDRSGDVHCNWCRGRGCLACVEARSKRAKEIMLHIQCSGDELNEVLAKVNGAVLRTTQVLVMATYHGPCKEIEDFVARVGSEEMDDKSEPPEIRAMRLELADMKGRTSTSFTVERIADIERKLAAHQEGVDSLKRLFAAEPEPQPPEWLKKKRRKKPTKKRVG